MPGLGPKDRNDPKYVSEVVPAGTGPFVIVDGGEVPYSQPREIPTLVARRLEEAGVDDAVIASPALGGPLDGLGDVNRAVVLRIPLSTLRSRCRA